MSDVVLDTFPCMELTYTYQVTDEGDHYRVWQSTGPISGRYVGGKFDDFVSALDYLTDYIKQGEQ